MKRPLVMGNWKMHGSLTKIEMLLTELLQLLPADGVAQCVVFPPAIYLPYVREKLTNSVIKWGAQNIYPQNNGAYTGEISAPMLLDYNCSYVLVGHSERRRIFHESEKFVAEKFHHVLEHGMIPVLCVGETYMERTEGLTEHVIAEQLRAVTALGAGCLAGCVIAYEPVWAIGTQQTASPEQVGSVHAFIRKWVAESESTAADPLSILYGGSVTAQNAATLCSMPDVDGVLVGGASLDARQFVDINKCISLS